MRLRTWLSTFVHDLLQPVAVVPIVGEPKQEHIGRYLVRQTLIAEVISGRDSTFIDKAAFVAGPLVINAVAAAGARRGVAELHDPGIGPRSGMFDF